MTDQPFTLEPGSGTKLLTADGFVELLIDYADSHLNAIAKFWAMPGEGWEDSLRTALAAYIEQRHPWADLGDPSTRQVYTTKGKKPKMADFVLNGTVAGSFGDEIIVEVKTQSIGRAKDFRNDFEKDIAKLDEVDENHLRSPRLAVGIFFTRDISTAPKGVTDPAENATVSINFTKWLQDYDHVYFSQEYQPIRRKAGTLTSEQIRKAGTIHTAAKPTDAVRLKQGTTLQPWEVHELGIVYKLLGPKAPPTPEVSKSESESESSDSVSENLKKRMLSNASGNAAKKLK
ncbi:hypothetical protein OUY22_27815 [Nonomuraea sp. MCN248]|uniref:Restriction endonuclease n=1 Tax=Nonomuraea corallina TaxID=2989783 RepID=A0ABT4SJ32_9ACTN|nr:hypothetical protein [Nonomuraea corallina]MDA0637227.1 hypothetical protein [Nonomuraea corallina]